MHLAEAIIGMMLSLATVSLCLPWHIFTNINKSLIFVFIVMVSN